MARSNLNRIFQRYWLVTLSSFLQFQVSVSKTGSLYARETKIAGLSTAGRGSSAPWLPAGKYPASLEDALERESLRCQKLRVPVWRFHWLHGSLLSAPTSAYIKRGLPCLPLPSDKTKWVSLWQGKGPRGCRLFPLSLEAYSTVIKILPIPLTPLTPCSPNPIQKTLSASQTKCFLRMWYTHLLIS